MPNFKAFTVQVKLIVG